MKRSNRILALVMCILSLLALSVSAFAEGGIKSESNLTIQYKYDGKAITGAQFDIYYIAERNGEYSFTLSDEFASSAVGIDCENQSEWISCALALEGFAAEKGIAPVCSGKTDAGGVTAFEGLKAGLYLVSGKRCTAGDTVYSSEAFIVALPELDADGNVNCDVTAHPKNIATEKTESETTHVIVVWDDKGSEGKRPERVRVKLLKDGEVYDTVDLSEENNWSYTWEELDSESTWTVTEVVPEGYTEKIEHIGDTFRITNTAKEVTPTPSPVPVPPEKKLPQTGQLWWPVPLMLCAGLLCVVLGLLRRKENE